MNELKRELSKLSGIDFFNPKFRDVFKKYFPEDKDAEEERIKELEGNKEAEDVTDEVATDVEEVKEENEDNADVPEKVEEVEAVEEPAEEVEEPKTEEKVEEVVDEVVKEVAQEEPKDNAVDIEETIKERIKEIIDAHPEWIRPKAKAFGMSVNESGDNLTEEEKRLKAMGIDPRN